MPRKEIPAMYRAIRHFLANGNGWTITYQSAIRAFWAYKLAEKKGYTTIKEVYQDEDFEGALW